MKPIPGPDLHRTTDRHLVLQPAPRPNGHFASDDTIGPNDHVWTNLCFRIDDCSGMNAHAATNANINVPSEVTSPLTRHRQLAFPMFPLALRSSASTINISPGTTGFRNLTASALKKYPIPLVSVNCFRSKILATCAIASTCRTPGITG